MNSCSNSRECNDCIKNKIECDVINLILNEKIKVYYSFSERLNLIHFLWVLYDEALILVPKLTFQYDLVFSLFLKSPFKMKKNYILYEQVYNNRKLDVLVNNRFNWDNFNHSISIYYKSQFIKSVKDKELNYTLHIFLPFFPIIGSKELSFNFAVKQHFKTFNLENFNFLFSKENLYKFFELIQNTDYFLIHKRFIVEKIFKSNLISLDYKFNKISFNYLLKNPQELDFFACFLENGLLRVDLNEIHQ